MIRTVLPALTILLGILVTAMPWGLPAMATFVPPLVVVMMVFCWRATPDAVLPPVAAMALGLVTDITTGGPLGFWGLMCLFAAGVGFRLRPTEPGRRMGVLWLAWIPTVTVLAGLGWLLASLYFFRWVDWLPIAFGAAAAVALFPAVYLLVRSINQRGAHGIVYGGGA